MRTDNNEDPEVIQANSQFEKNTVNYGLDYRGCDFVLWHLFDDKTAIRPRKRGRLLEISD